jgi:hypothetical protein
MPVKSRVAKDRRPTFSAEAIALFERLERMPGQDSQAFEDGSHQLARLLNLVPEFWTGNHVNDRSDGPCHPPGYISREDWFCCRAVRRQLLAAVAEREKAPAH